MTKANYCCHFIKGIRLARAEKALTGMCEKPVEIGPAKRAGRFPLNSNIEREGREEEEGEERGRRHRKHICMHFLS